MQVKQSRQNYQHTMALVFTYLEDLHFPSALLAPLPVWNPLLCRTWAGVEICVLSRDSTYQSDPSRHISDLIQNII